MAVETPYLNAIQAIPGDTMTEKFRWIARTTRERLLECNSLEEVAEAENIPKPLAPLIQVQAALIMNKKDSTNLKSYQAITEALKSRDALIANKAFECRRFFDGTNKTITNVQYFFENLFPFVSLQIRTRIIKTLANRLRSKNPDLAECFFVAVNKSYGLQQALPLLLACSESFMYNAIVEKRIVLGRKQIKDLFRMNPDFMVQYLKLKKVNSGPNYRDYHPVSVYEFADFLPVLIKKRLNSFIELHELYHMKFMVPTLSNKCAEIFLKNGKEHLQKNPKLYINMLPLQLISANRMESIFAKLFPEDIAKFDTGEMLDYLKYYPQEKTVDLLLQTYREVYGKDLLDTPKNVTPALLKMLPLEERVKQARIKLAEEDDDGDTRNSAMMSFTKCWKCYLSTEEALPNFKKQISTSGKMEDRTSILRQMIFCCKVNNDDQALLDVFTYINDRHRNEQQWLFLMVFECLMQLYEAPQLNENHWAILIEMILRLRTKGELSGNSAFTEIIEAAIHFKIINKQPVEQMIEIMIETKCAGYINDWNILTKYPEYERMCLEVCLSIVSQKYDSEKAPWHKDKVGALFDLSNSMYVFNDRHVNKNNWVKRMSVKNYPWLMQKITEVLSNKEKHDVYLINNFQCMFKEHEKDLFARFWPVEANKIDIYSKEAVRLLMKNPGIILERWKEYADASTGRLKIGDFVKIVRWYKEIPVRFVKEAFDSINKDKNLESVGILAYLLHGDTFAKLIEPLMPTTQTIDVHDENAKLNYFHVINIASASKIINPPLPLHLVARLLEGEYLSRALVILVNTCRRSPLMDVISFAETMSSQRVAVRKHGIRLMNMVASREHLRRFFVEKWESEKHYSIREVIFAKAKNLFKNDLDEDTWKMFSRMIATLTLSEKAVVKELIKLISNVPDQMVAELVKLILDTIDRFAQAGVSKKEISSNTATLFSSITSADCSLLSDDFVEQLLRRFLFHTDQEITLSVSEFVIKTYLLPTEDFEKRFNLFAKVFVETVKNGWNVPSPTTPSFYPVNHSVNQFVSKFTNNVCWSDEKNLRLIEGVLNIFSSVVTPLMNPTSFLKLMYLKEFVILNDPKRFGNRIGQLLPELVNVFSVVYIPNMANVLRDLVTIYDINDYKEEDRLLSVVEGLLQTGTAEATLMAVNVFKSMNRSNCDSDRYDNLVQRFSSSEHPAIKGIIADVLNTAC